MNNTQGTFIVIEGTDGSGKGTQFSLLAERLQKAGYEVALFDFPQYESPSSYFVRQYLNGAYGEANDVGPYTGSLFYALDRYEAAGEIRKALAAGKVVLANRFVGSNMAHQGAKFVNAEERRGYFIWLDNLEFEMLRIPRPTASFVLRVPAEIAQTLVDQKEQRSYTDKKRDIHEADLAHLQRSVQVYDEMCELFPRDFVRIDCVRHGRLMDVENIQRVLWEKIDALLPPPPQLEMSTPAFTTVAEDIQAQAHEATIVENPFVKLNNDGSYELTKEGQAFLQQATTEPAGGTYALTGKLAPATIAALFTKLYHGTADLRLVLLDEFSGSTQKDAAFLRQATKQGDAAFIQHLAQTHIVIENASSLLASELRAQPNLQVVQPETFRAHFNYKSSEGNYPYHTPANLSDEARTYYCAAMDKIFDAYSYMLQTLSDHLKQSRTSQDGQTMAWHNTTAAQARHILHDTLPVAASTNIGIAASAITMLQAAKMLQQQNLNEYTAAGEALAVQTQKALPDFFTNNEEENTAGQKPSTSKLSSLAQSVLADNYAASVATSAMLTSFLPRNELDLTAEMLFAHGGLPLNETIQAAAKLPYAQKALIFETYLNSNDIKVLQKTSYTWDIVASFDTFNTLQCQNVGALTRQQLTPRYGYEVPKIIEEAGLSDYFEACFDISLQLHSYLQSAGYAAEAEYATLYGHRLRMQFTHTAADTTALFTHKTLKDSEFTNILQEMQAKLAAAHPLLSQVFTKE
ncbi:MAG TPA: hypothetical protein VLG16_02710 [Candidatus Saccharimonadales bacterium]|nr:hypothetical protein [Candidatus Saccharimonadales bacterium]